MADRILLLCACASPGLRQGRFPASDALDALDARGHTAAARKRCVAPSLRHGTAFSSPAAAALQTAAGLGLAPCVDAALRDTDYGQWGARSLKDIAREDPERLRAWLTDFTVAPPAGESFVQVVARVDAWLETMLATPASDLAPAPLAAHAEASIIVVTHPAVIRTAVLRGVGMSLGAAARLDIMPLSVMTLERRQDAWASPAGQATL